MLLQPPTSTLFPYTTLFRSKYVPLIGSTSGKPNDSIEIARCYLSRPDKPIVEKEKGADTFGVKGLCMGRRGGLLIDRKSTRLNSSHTVTSYAVFCLNTKRDV